MNWYVTEFISLRIFSDNKVNIRLFSKKGIDILVVFIVGMSCSAVGGESVQQNTWPLRARQSALDAMQQG